MKRALVVLVLLLLMRGQAGAEELDTHLAQTIDSLDIAALEESSGQDNLGALLLRLAKGELVWSAEHVLDVLLETVLGEVRKSFARMMSLITPALFCSAAGILRTQNKKLGELVENACFLALAVVMVADMKTYLFEAEQTVIRMAQLMQTLFPMLLTLLVAVGATKGAALFQPAISAASGTMTALVRGVALRLAMGVAVVTLLDQLSPQMRLSRLGALLRTMATWTIGIAFTVFIGVTAMHGMTASVSDGISLRAAKYAVDNFVPVVGGMFADTMDTLVGCALLVKNALGVTGLALLLSVAALPMIRTLCAVLVYKLCAALLQPVGSERMSGALNAFAEVLMLLFIIQLSVGAMFFLLVAQILAVGNATVNLR